MQNISHAEVGSLFKKLTTMKATDYPTKLRLLKITTPSGSFKGCFDVDWLYFYSILNVIKTLVSKDMANEEKKTLCKEVRAYLMSRAQAHTSTTF
jgi:hypothetical protein